MKKNLPVILVVIVVIVLVFLGYNIQANNPVSSKQKIEEIVKETILNNGKLILESVEKHQQQQMQQEKEMAKERLGQLNEQIISDTTSPYLGNPEATKVIVEFFDYNCIHCKKTSEMLKSLLAKRNDVKVIMKELPILGATSQYAAKVALAVHKLDPSKYAMIHHALMSERLSSDDVIMEILKKNNIDVNKIKSMMNVAEIEKMLHDNNKLAVEIGLRGTPAFIIDGSFIPGALSEDRLNSLLK